MRSSSLKRCFFVGEVLDDRLEHEVAVGELAEVGDGADPAEHRVALGGFELAPLDLLGQRLLEARDHGVGGASATRLRSTTSMPALAATSAMPEPMIPEPTIPTRLIAHDGLPPAVDLERPRLPIGSQISPGGRARARVSVRPMSTPETEVRGHARAGRRRGVARRHPRPRRRAARGEWRHRGPGAADRGGVRAPRAGRRGAAAHFAKLGATARTLPVLHRTRGRGARTSAEAVRDARFVYFADGSPLHLRSVLKGSALFDALLAAYRSGAVLAASGAGATVLCDPMVDPRGGAYTVGLGVVRGRGGLPVPRQRGRPPPRTLDRPAARRTRCSSASTRRPRSSANPARSGPSPAPARSPSTRSARPSTHLGHEDISLP